MIRDLVDGAVEQSIKISVYDDIWSLIHLKKCVEGNIRSCIFERCYRVIYRFLHMQAYNSVLDFIRESGEAIRYDSR